VARLEDQSLGWHTVDRQKALVPEIAATRARGWPARGLPARAPPTSAIPPRASSARLELSPRAGELLLRVVDNGVGGADPTGGGLRGLSDRVAAVDGVLDVVSPAGGGAVIEARLAL
jgi:hypothetical protein